MSYEDEQQDELTFGGGGAAAFGALIGFAFAVGVPWVVLVHGQVLGEHAQRLITIGAVCVGGLVTLACAILGVVMPKSIKHRPYPWQLPSNRTAEPPPTNQRQ